MFKGNFSRGVRHGSGRLSNARTGEIYDGEWYYCCISFSLLCDNPIDNTRTGTMGVGKDTERKPRSMDRHSLVNL